MWLLEEIEKLVPGTIYHVRFKDGHIQEIAGQYIQFKKKTVTLRGHFHKKVRKAGRTLIRKKKCIGYNSDDEENFEMRTKLAKQQVKSMKRRNKATEKYAKNIVIPRYF